MTLNEIATKLGLTAIGIADTKSPPPELAHLNDWLKAGHNGKMAFLARDPERRCDVLKIMPECRTVIVAAMRYSDMPNVDPPNARGPSVASLPRDDKGTSKYLQHEDYHKVMMERLEALVAELKKDHPSANFKCYVDTGPVLEKAWAARAGLGFIGKNTLLISPEHGSQMALGIVLTDLSLPFVRGGSGWGRYLPPPSPPYKGGGKQCGSCTACLDACPTKALIAPYTLDARKCVSYKFFIEKKDGGCDVCQDVCPFNKETI